MRIISKSFEVQQEKVTSIATLFYDFSTKSVSFLLTFQGHFNLSGFNSKQEENGEIQTDTALNINADWKECWQFPVYQN